MNLKEQVLAYIERRIYPDKHEQFLRANRLNSLFCEPLNSRTQFAKLHIRMMEEVLLRITALLRENGIEPIHFKGITLARMIYDDPTQRRCSDIDFYICPPDFDTARSVLTANGSVIEEEFDGHHLTLNLRGIRIELHASFFHPNDGIPFMISATDLTKIEVAGTTLTTLAPTALFSLLFLHYFTHAKKSRKYEDKKYLLQYYQNWPSVVLSKLYDIALLTHKYGEQIEWDRCTERLRPLCACPEFQFTIAEFTEIFPDTLPDAFLDQIVMPEYLQKNDFPVFSALITQPERPYDDILADVLAHSAQTFPCTNSKPDEYRFHIDELDVKKPLSHVLSGIPPESSADLSFRFDFWVQNDMLHFTLDVIDDIIMCLSEGDFPENYDSSGYCDSFTVNITSAEHRYTLHRIFAFITQNGQGQIYLSVYDICGSIIPLKDIAQSELTLNSDGYTAQIGIPLGYLGLKGKDDSFYFNVMVSDSDSKTTGANTALALDSTVTAWENCRTYPKAYIV